MVFIGKSFEVQKFVKGCTLCDLYIQFEEKRPKINEEI